MALSQCSQLVPLGSGRFRRVERDSGTAVASSDHLEPTPAKIQVRTCQACDAGSRSQTVVASGAAVLTFTHQRWRAVSRHSNVPSVSTTSQSSGGRASASVHPVHKTLVDSSRRVRCIVCSAAAASAGACFVSLSLGGVYRGCSRVDDCSHIGGSVTASSKLFPCSRFLERVRSRIYVVVCSYCSSSCRCVWDRGRLCIAPLNWQTVASRGCLSL